MRKALVGIMALVVLFALGWAAARQRIANASPLPQASSTSAPATQGANFKNLLTITGKYLSAVKLYCRTATCNALVAQGTTLVTNTQADLTNGRLTQQERKNFHENLRTILTQIHADMMKNLTPAERKAVSACKTCETSSMNVAKPRLTEAAFHRQVTGGNGNCDQNRCNECTYVFTQAVAICALYVVASPIAAAICEGVAIAEYNNCEEQYCLGC
ncbi:MAG: hypothetical protein ACRD8A_10735 [Candidatus Acidiferrales bacterium]